MALVVNDRTELRFNPLCSLPNVMPLKPLSPGRQAGRLGCCVKKRADGAYPTLFTMLLADLNDEI